MTEGSVLASRLALCAGFVALLLPAPWALAGEGAFSGKVSFYFSAHEDDWQLFMNPSAFQDVVGKAKTVFVHLTAGDAGLGTGTACGQMDEHGFGLATTSWNADGFMKSCQSSSCAEK